MVRTKDNPLESVIQRRVKKRLEVLGWHVEIMSCNAYQKGIPDLYCFKHFPGKSKYGNRNRHRWVDIKRPKGSTLTKDQCQKWPVWEEIGLGVWILNGTEPDPEAVLMGPPNFRDWWKDRYDKYLVRPGADILLEEFDADQCDS